MGSYSSLRIDGVEIFSDKHTVDSRLAEIFRDADFFDSGPSQDEEEIRLVHLRAPVNIVRDRLDIMGFTRTAAVAEFERERQRILAENRAYVAEVVEDLPQDYVSQVRKGIRIFESLTFEGWLDFWKEVKAAGGYHSIYSGQTPCSELAYFLIKEDADSDFGFTFFTEPLLRVRALLESYGDSSSVIYDLSELVYGGYHGIIRNLQHYGYLKDLAVDSNIQPADDYEGNDLFSRTAEGNLIVLTEGHSDVEILKAAVAVLYPHLVDYISFLDFGLAKAPGGAATLVTVIKALAGIGLSSRFVAVFDNDTAARDALRPLAQVSLPQSMRVIRLPDIELGKSYPTIGPTSGIVPVNVNGLAGSIELYLGRDVLTGADGLLTPVQWLGYSATQKAYHGELLDKANIQKRFFHKAERCLADRNEVQDINWQELRTAIDAIRRAFE